MGFSLTQTPHTNLQLQFHSLFSSKPFLSLQFHQTCRVQPKRSVPKLRAQSENGAAVLTSEEEKKLDASNYGRQYFPLAAVVGQVCWIIFIFKKFN